MTTPKPNKLSHVTPVVIKQLTIGETKDEQFHRCKGYHVSHDLQLLIDHGDVDALAALSDHTADTDGWDGEFQPGYASDTSDGGDIY